ncbi:ATP-binding protein [Nocardioides zeae]|uniref:histidine kinase n=1 Tax=Nocardioides imazamoxiresistens TaxID=3231893 RepID=A0ABU3PQD1_9ACTN|nr:ATP-binding protein [Nocardioides zeae]MDT9591428.1 ATP-binding protein [Nocardioides zeae]
MHGTDDRHRRAHVATAGVLALTAVGVLVSHFLQPESAFGQASYLAFIVGAPVLGYVGARRRRGTERLVGIVISAGLASFALGDLLWFALQWTGRAPEISVADVFWGSSYLGIGGGLLLMIALAPHPAGPRDPDEPPPPPRLDPGAVVDALTVATLSVAVLWTLSVGELISNDAIATGTRVVRGGYAVMSSVLVGLVVRALWLRRARPASALPLVLGASSWLVADLGYLAWSATGVGESSLDVLWMSGSVLMALGASVSSTPTGEAAAAYRESTRSRLVVATVPLLVPPLLILLGPGRTDHASLAGLAIAMIVLTGLAFARTSRMLAAERDAREEALAASRAKSDFLATMSHEIRTPLNGVLGLNELLLTTRLAPQQREYAEGVRTAGTSLLALINDILDLAKVEAGRVELERVRFAPSDVVDEAVALLAETAHSRRVALAADLDDDAALVVLGDPGRLRQVVVNLLSNAVKFTEAGGEVRVGLSVTRTSPTAALVRITVADTGIGMSPEVQLRVFAPFTQADSSTTRRFGGTGLGLAIVRRLVDAMDGRVDLTSAEGAGTTFTVAVTLPVADPASAPAPPPLPAPPVSAPTPVPEPGPAPEPAPPATRRVLVVDDDEINRIVAIGILAKLGYAADEAADGTRALEAMADGAYDAVLLDCQMPGRDGYEVATTRRREEQEQALPHLPIVAMTANVLVGERERCLAAGMDDYVSKPVTPASIGEALRRTMSATGA